MKKAMKEEPYRVPTLLEQIYSRQCVFHTKIKPESLPHALAILTDKRIISYEVAKKVLQEHAAEQEGKEPKNMFARVHEAFTKRRRNKKFDELMARYDLHLAQRSGREEKKTK